MRRTLPAAILVLVLFATGGCGGGGGGESGLSYTGQTSPAAIDNNNFETIAIQVYQAGDTSSTLASPLAASATPPSAADSPNLVTLVQTLKSFADLAVAPKAAPVSAMSRSDARPLDVISVDNTYYDGFGGSATVTLSLDNATGYFNGTFVFRDWHGDTSTVISGTASVSGHIDLTLGVFTEIEYAFALLTVTDASGSVTVAGTVGLANAPPSATATVNLIFRDNVTGKTVWIRDYNLSISEGPDDDLDGTPDYVEISVSGRVYLHDYGFIDITTQAALVIWAGEANPSTGTLVFTGSGGRSVRFTVIDEVAGFFLEADLEPDGTYEWTSDPHPWG